MVLGFRCIGNYYAPSVWRRSSLQPQNSITLFTSLILICRQRYVFIICAALCTWISTRIARSIRCRISQSIQLPLTQDSNYLLPWIESFLSSRMGKGGEINVGRFQGEEQFWNIASTLPFPFVQRYILAWKYCYN